MKFLIKSISLLTILFLLLCGCKNSNEGSESSAPSNSEVHQTEASIPDVIENGADSDDPQPLVKNENVGASVNANKLQPNEGKANGIDVSKWQGRIDWKKVKASGIDFAIIRIGYRGENGKLYKDSCADYNIQQADKNGILVGVYFFSTAVSKKEAIEEANWVADSVKSYPISYPVVWDCEGYLDTESRMYSLSKEHRTTNALNFLNRIEALGYTGMFYSSASELENSTQWITDEIDKKFKIWVASYPDITYPQISTPNYSGRYDMWQYTNKGKVSGIDIETDIIVSYFTPKKAVPKSKKPAPEASVPQKTDNIYTYKTENVTPKDTVNLRAEASTNAEIIGKAYNGDKLTRTATGANGWSKLNWNGKTVYAVSSYLTTDLSYKTPEKIPDDGFKAVNEKVTAKDKTNLRSVPNSSDSSTIVYTLKNGETATRIGISQNGWSKLNWNGKTVYAVSSYLTTDLSYKPATENNSSDTPSSGLKTQFTDVSEQVTAKSETNLRSLPSVTDGEIVYTLKNGEYLTRTGISSNGWSRLEHNGKTVYAVTSLLTK